MKTDLLPIPQTPEKIADALDKIELIALYTGMARREATSMRLLAEELLSATKDILAVHQGQLWMETSDTQFALHLGAVRPTSKAEREALIALSKNGELTPAKGLFARLGAAMGKLLVLDDDELYASVFTDYAMFSGGMHAEQNMPMYTYHYMPRVEPVASAPSKPVDELSGIEKSIIDAIVDDIQVTVKSGNIEIIAIKNLQ